MVEALMPYAQAIYEVAKEANKEEAYMEVLKELSSIWENEKDFVCALGHPKIARATKRGWLKELFSASLDDVMMQTLFVLNEHNVVNQLDDIYDAYVECYRKAHGIEIVKVESASKLEDEQVSSLKKMLEEKLDKTIELDIKIKPELIAGLRVVASDIVLDNTVLSRLNAIKEKINN